VRALPFSEIKSTFPVLHNPANRNRAVPITEKDFHYAFTNNLTEEQSKAVYDRYVVPVSGRMLFQGRSHCTCGEDGWEEVADLALDWALAPTSGDLDQG